MKVNQLTCLQNVDQNNLIVMNEKEPQHTKFIKESINQSMRIQPRQYKDKVTN